MNFVKSRTFADLGLTGAPRVVMPVIFLLEVHGDVFPARLHALPLQLFLAHLILILQLLNNHLLVPCDGLFVLGVQRVFSVFAR